MLECVIAFLSTMAHNEPNSPSVVVLKNDDPVSCLDDALLKGFLLLVAYMPGSVNVCQFVAMLGILHTFPVCFVLCLRTVLSSWFLAFFGSSYGGLILESSLF